MKYYTLILIIALMGCKSKKGFELEILTKEISCLDGNKEEYINYLSSDKMPPKESQTIITYKLKNNTDDTYYFNVSDLNRAISDNTDNYIQIDKAFIAFIDSKEKPMYVRIRALKEFFGLGTYDYLGYNSYWRYNNKNNNFIIHPGETLYFEWFLVLPFGTLVEDEHYSIEFNKKESYSAQLFMYSQGKDYKKKISRTDLKTIEENGYKVFDGVIKSKNKIPVVFRKESKAN